MRKKSLNPNTLQLIRQIVGGLLVLLLLAMLLASTWYVTRLPSLTIQNITVSGGQTISHDLVHTLANSELEGEYMRLIPKRFSLLYPEQKIVDSVSQIERIKNIRVNKNSLIALHVAFDEYVPDSLWCGSNAENCVFVDAGGYAFAEAPSLTGGSFLRLGKLGVKPVSNTQAFDIDQYNQLKTIVDLLENNGWFIELAEVDVAGDAYLTLTEGGELKIALGDTPEQIVENLFTVLAAPEFREISPGNFEYIDLRFGNKVFVNELEPEVATSTEFELE